MRLINKPGSIIGRICWSWAKRRRRIVAIRYHDHDRYIVQTVSDDGQPNCSPYHGYFWDEELTRPLTLQEVKQC